MKEMDKEKVLLFNKCDNNEEEEEEEEKKTTLLMLGKYGMELFPNCYDDDNNYYYQNSPSGCFESALSSMVSSPVAGGGDGGGDRELIGSICNSAGAENSSPHYSSYSYSYSYNNNNKLLNHHLMMMSSDQANWYPHFPPAYSHPNTRNMLSSSSHNGFKQQQLTSPLLVVGKKRKTPQTTTTLPLLLLANTPPNLLKTHPKQQGGKEESNDVSNGGRKRKENEDENGNQEEEEDEEEENDNKKKNTSKKKRKKKKEEEEAPKSDFIHVRARRGQATDSHSLAERVRREKIGERMKFLQDLVPGCNKMIGKAVMLDEIINYVQSLQRQVEFLSMKLSAVNPRMELNAEALLRNDIIQYRALSSTTQNIYPALQQNTYLYGGGGVYQSAAQQQRGGGFGLFSSSLMNSSPHLLLNPFENICPLSDGFTDAATSQSSAFWGDDLHTVVHMGYGHGLPQTYDAGIGDMKVEQ